MDFLIAGILLRVGFQLMDRDICTSISGQEEGHPRELVLASAYLGGQSWEPSVSGLLEEEGDWKRSGIPPGPVQSNQLCSLRCRLPGWGFRFALTSPLGRPALPPRAGARDREHSRERGESQARGGRKRGRKDSGGVSFPAMSGSATKREWSSPGSRAPPRAEGGLKPPHLALPAPLIRVQKKAREGAVLVVIASVRLSAVQLHIHLVPRIKV